MFEANFRSIILIIIKLNKLILTITLTLCLISWRWSWTDELANITRFSSSINDDLRSIFQSVPNFWSKIKSLNIIPI